MLTRRELVAAALAGLATTTVAAALPTEALAGPVRRTIRRTRRRVRRRHRRRVRRRVVAGTTYVVVPVAVAVGWELEVDSKVVVVKAIEPREIEGAKVEVVIVADSSGKTSEYPIIREDDATNSAELEGSVLPDGDTTTPGVDSEIEE